MTTALALAVAAPAQAQATTTSPEVSSTYLAGYQLNEPSFARGSVTFPVPAVTCTDPNSFTGVALGLGEETSSSGLPSVGAVVWAICAFGTAEYEVLAVSGSDTEFGFGATAGDQVTASFSEGSRLTVVTLADHTSGAVTKATSPPAAVASLTYGSFPVYSSNGLAQLDVPQFGTVRMRNATSESGSLSSWNPTKLVRQSGTTTEISTSAFNPQGGFTLRYVAP